jgi:hypothetical protein
MLGGQGFVHLKHRMGGSSNKNTSQRVLSYAGGKPK